MEQLLSEHYGLTNCSLSKMDGYISTNYKVASDQGTFVLKVYPQSKFEDVTGETAVIKELTNLPEKAVSRPVENKNGRSLSITESGVLRLLTFVSGKFLAEVDHTIPMFESMGQFLASMDKDLIGFRNSAIESRKLDWDLQHINQSRQLKEVIRSPEDKKVVDYFFLQWDQHVYPVLPSLRKSIIHNDGNDWNILVNDNKVSGIIDFGDCSYTPLINELAIAITYAIFEKEDPIKWAKPIISGYHQIIELEEQELDILYYLIAGRLCMSVCKSANEKNIQPDSEYITISEKPAWDLLRKWIAINPIHARSEFYAAVGKETAPTRDIDEIISKRLEHLSPILSMSYKTPIYMHGAAFQYMYDQYGNTLLDAYNNIPHVGHQHPKVVEAGQTQMAKLNTNTRYLYNELAEYAERLLSKFPESLNKVYFVNSGSAASDLAIRLAQAYTNNPGIVVMEHGYHGNTRQGIEISQYKYDSKGGTGKSNSIVQAAIPDTYRGKYTGLNAGIQFAKDLKTQIENHPIDLSAFVAEPIVGCGGQVPLAEGYLKEVYPMIRSRGGLCISDEVQTGFGRMGSHFWGFELQEVVPDIVILGKPMANGHPMGAVVTTTEIAEAFDNGMEFFSSFGGNPVSCAIGSAVLHVIEEENLQENALSVGNYYMEQLGRLQNDFPEIGDVRGSGLFIGMELVKDDSKSPNTALASRIKNELRNQNVLVSTDGLFDSVIKTKPPLCFSHQNVDEVVEKIQTILKN